MKSEQVLEPKQLALAAWVLLHTFKVPPLVRSSVADIGLLLLVNLSCINDFLNGACRHEPVDLHVTSLANSIGPILGLEILSLEVSAVLELRSLCNMLRNSHVTDSSEGQR